MDSVEAVCFEADCFGELEPRNLMAFDWVAFVVAGPVSMVEVQHVDVEAAFAGEDYGDVRVVALDLLAGVNR